MSPTPLNRPSAPTREEVHNARLWFRGKISGLQGPQIKQPMEDLTMKNMKPQNIIGSMAVYKYDPKHKATLPYYDIFPLVIMLELDRGSHLGLNLHYLPPSLRRTFLTHLFEVITNDKFDKTTRFRLTYQLLNKSSKFRYFKPCIKRYLTPHVKSRMQFVKPSEWHKAILLPTAKFRGASQEKVWADSKEKWS